jgi:rod shape-determining protein MreC
MYDRTVRRRRAVLAVFVVMSLVLITAYFGESTGGALHTLQRGAQEALAPLEEGVSRALKPVRDLVGWTGDVFGAKGENEQLKREVEDLRQEVAEAQIDRREAEQLRGLVGLPKRLEYPASLETVAARVIAHSPTAWYSTVQIDKGSSDGVRAGQPVVASEGLAGKVESTTDGTARVTLITDASSAVSAQVFPAGARGIVRPQVSNPDDLLLDYIQSKRKVAEGSTIVTSGSTSSRFESLFPRGIPIGKVSRVDPEERELYQRVHVRPFADLRRIDFVQVLRYEPDEARAEVTAP